MTESGVAAAHEVRRRLAERVRVPLWFGALYVTAMLAVFLSVVLVSAPDAVTLDVILSVAVLAAADRVLRRAAGFGVPVGAGRSYPRARLAGAFVWPVVLGAAALTWWCRDHASVGVAVVVAVVAALACCAARGAVLLGLRADLRSGRGLGV